MPWPNIVLYWDRKNRVSIKSTNNNNLCMTLSNDTTNERRQFIIAKAIFQSIFYLILLLEILAVVCWIGFIFIISTFCSCCCCFISIIEHKHVLPLPTQHSKTTTANSFIQFHIINLKLLSG